MLGPSIAFLLILMVLAVVSTCEGFNDERPGVAFFGGITSTLAVLLLIGMLVCRNTELKQCNHTLPTGYQTEVVIENARAEPMFVRYIQHDCDSGNTLKSETIMPGAAKLFTNIKVISSSTIRLAE